MVKLTFLLSFSLPLSLEGMRNLSISCSLVSMIILGASLVVFWIGLIEREVPPVLVVSVLYLLSGGSNVAQNAICEWRKYGGCFHPPRSYPLFSSVFNLFHSARPLPSKATPPSKQRRWDCTYRGTSGNSLVFLSFDIIIGLAKRWAPGCENFSVEAEMVRGLPFSTDALKGGGRVNEIADF